MKYFTAEWWFSDNPRSQTVREAYESHLRAIRLLLPAGLLQLDAKHTLHDSRLTKLDHRQDDSSVLMAFDGWDRTLSYSVRYELLFSGVSSLVWLPSAATPALPDGYGDLGDVGYWELDLTGSQVEMRLLFAACVELIIVFSGFGFGVVPRTT